MSELQKIKEQVEERLQSQQASKEFKDVGRVAQTRKEKSAYKLISGQILNQLEEDSIMAYNMVKKENVWPEIDIATERGNGTTSGGAYLKAKLREAVPTRPKDDKAKRATYVLFLEMLQKDLAQCFSVAQIKELVNKYRELPMDKVIGYFIDPAYLTASEQEKNTINEKLKQNSNIRIAMLYGSRSFIPKIINEVFSSRFENTFFNLSDASHVLWHDAINKEPITEEESKAGIEKLLERKQKFIEANNKLIEDYKAMDAKALSFDMESKWSLASENKKLYRKDIEKFREFTISYYERRVRMELPRFEEKEKLLQPKPNDWSWIDTPEVKDETKKPKADAINTKAPLSYIKRTGGYKIDTNTPQEIVNRFGFSAVNYGNYVDDVWSKQHTNHFLGAICDLAEILNIDIKKINELGKLSIAFGAKGRKGHLATYFPQTKDINLTKGNGDGSVAHEWGHYFDNVIVELDFKRASNSFASENGAPDAEIAGLFKELMDFFYKGDAIYTPKVPMLFYAKKQDKAPSYSVRVGGGWDSKQIEIKSTIEETLEQLSGFMKVSRDNHATQVRLFGYVIDAFGLDTYEIPMQLTTSYFYHKSAYNIFQYCFKTPSGIEIGTRTRTKYWTSAVELFARAWETVIFKKLIDKGRASNYLVAGIPTEDIISESYYVPYPAGKELEYIEVLIDKIVVSVKKKFEISNFIPPSDIKEDEYLDLQNNASGKTDTGMVVEILPEGNKEVEFIDKDKIVKTVEESKKENMETNDNTNAAEGIEEKIPLNTIVLLEKPEGYGMSKKPFKTSGVIVGYEKDEDGNLLYDVRAELKGKTIRLLTRPNQIIKSNESEMETKDIVLSESDILNSAIQDVLTIKDPQHEYKLKYGGMDLTEAKVLYSLSGKEFETSSFDPTTLMDSIKQELEKHDYIEYLGEDKYVLSERGKDFVTAVNTRIETIKGIRAGTDLFPEEAGVIHEPERIYHDMKGCLLEEGENEMIYLFEGKEFIIPYSATASGKNERWKILDFYKYGMNVENLPINKLADKKKDKKISFKELRKLFEDKDIEIDGIGDIKTLDHCLKILTKCIDNVDVNEALAKEKQAHTSTKQALQQKEDAEKAEIARIAKEAQDKKESEEKAKEELKRVETESLKNAYDALVLLTEMTEGEEKQKALDAIEALKIVMDIQEPVIEAKTDTGKVKLKNILIHWAEGDTSGYGFPATFESWEAANDAVKPVLESMIKEGGGGYNKTKFTVTFEDGETYEGRLYVSESEDNPATTNNVVGKHIYDYLNYLQSDKSSNSEQSKKEIREWLQKYDLGDDAFAGGGSIGRFNINSLIGKSIWDKNGSHRIIKVNEISKDNIKVERKMSPTSDGTIETSYTMKQLIDLSNGKIVDGEELIGHNMEKGGIAGKKFVREVKKMHNSIKEVVLKDGTHIEGEKLMASGGGVGKEFKVDKKYTHFAVRKSDGKIVTGWDYKKVDKEDIKTYTNMDLKDMELKPSDFKIVTGKSLISKGINPFDWASWRNMYEGGGKIEKVMGEFKRGELKTPQGKVVKKRKRAVAIALSEARAAGEIK